jgi:hypothetical protein
MGEGGHTPPASQHLRTFGPMEVRVVDIDMPIGSMVSFILKLTIASIPTAIIVFVLFALLVALFGGSRL